MKRRRQDTDQLHQDHTAAVDKARMWGNRATTAHDEGRKSDAARCKDKARDWSSRARQIERRQKDDKD
jgi:hypothetical protein